MVIPTGCVQKEDWKCHRGECKGIAKVHPKVPTPLMRMVMRAIQRKNEKQTQNKVSFQYIVQVTNGLTHFHAENGNASWFM